MAEQQLSAALTLELGSFTAALNSASSQLSQFATQATAALNAASSAIQRVTQATQAQAQAVTQATSTVNNYNSSVNNAVNILGSFNTATHAASAATSSFASAMQIAAGVGLATTIGGIVSVLKQWSIEAISVAVRMESLQASFRFLSGGIQAGAQTLGFLRTEANRLGLDFLSLAGHFKNFEAVTRGTSLEGEKARKIFVSVAEASRVLGLSTVETGRVFLAFEQMLSKGRVQSEELVKQLQALPGAQALFARALGTTTEGLREMMKAGLDAGSTLEKVGAQLQREYGEGVPAAAEKADSSFKRFANNARDVSVAVGESILVLLKPVMDVVNAAADKIGSLNKGKADQRQQFFESALSGSGIDLGQLTEAERTRLDTAARETRGSQAGRNAAAMGYQATFDALKDEIYAQQTINRLKKEQGLLENAVTRQTESTAEGLKKIEGIVRGIQGGEAGTIHRIATSVGVDPAFLTALRRTENGRAGREFGVLSVPAPTYEDQGRIAAQSIKAAELRFPGKAKDDSGRYTNEFIDAFSARYAPRGAGNDPTGLNSHHAANLKKFYGSPADERPDFHRANPVAFGASLTSPLEKLKEEARELDKAIESIQDLFKIQPALAAQLTPELKTNLDLLEQQRKALGDAIGAQTREPAELKRRATEVVEIARKRADDERQNIDDIAHMQRAAVKNHTDDLQTAFDKEISLSREAATQVKAIMAERNASPEQLRLVDVAQAEKESNLVLDLRRRQFVKEQTIEEALSAIKAKETQSRADDYQASLDKQIDGLVKLGATEDQLGQARAAGAIAKQRVVTEETQKELGKLAAAQQQLAEDIAKPIQEIFEGILSGTGNILSSLKTMFFKFLAELAAQALATKIVIPLVASIGGAVSSGGSIFGAIGSLFGGDTASGATGTTGASDATGGGTVLGSGYQALSGASAVSGALGGPTLSSLGGSVFGGTGAGSLVSSIGTTTLGEVGNFVGLNAAPETLAAAGGNISAVGAGELASTTLGTVASGVASGLAVALVVNELNKLVGLTGGGVKGAIGGALAGAAGGAVVGSIIPVVGTAVGAIVGAALGAIFGGLFGGGPKEPEFQITGAQTPHASFDSLTGLQLDTSFGLTSTKHQALHQQGTYEAFTAQIDKGVNELFQWVIDSFTGLAPQIQEGLVAPLNDVFSNITADVILGRKFEGKDWGKDLNEFFGTTLPNEIKNQLEPVLANLTKAVGQISPVVERFNDVINQANEDIIRLSQAAAQQHLSLQQTIVGIQQGLFTGAQSYKASQESLTQGLSLLEQASPSQKIQLIPELQKLAETVFAGAQGVFGTTNAPEGIQSHINELVQNAAVLGNPVSATALAPLQRELANAKANETESAAQLRAVQTQLVGQLQGLQGSSLGAFGNLIATVQSQQNLAQAQITALVDGLKNPGGVPAIVASALEHLQEIQAALAPFSDAGQQEASIQVQTALLTGQVASLQSIDAIQHEALAVLQGIANSLIGAPSHAAGIKFVPSTGLALLHQGERVIPAQQNGGEQGMVNHFHITGSDPERVAEVVARKLERMSKYGQTTLVTR